MPVVPEWSSDVVILAVAVFIGMQYSSGFRSVLGAELFGGTIGRTSPIKFIVSLPFVCFGWWRLCIHAQNKSKELRRHLYSQQFLIDLLAATLATWVLFYPKAAENRLDAWLPSAVKDRKMNFLHDLKEHDKLEKRVMVNLFAQCFIRILCNVVGHLITLGRIVYMVIEWKLFQANQGSSRGRTCSSLQPKKILIVHGSIGNGHKRAAEALEKGFKERHPELDVKVVDIIDYAGDTFEFLYKTSYLNMVESSMGSQVVGYLFESSNESAPGTVKRIVQEIFLLRFIQFVYKFEPDVVVNTHFLSCEILASLRRHNWICVPQVTVITDYDAHAFWANFPTDRFYVGQDGAIENLMNANPAFNEDDPDFKTNKCIVSGIPTVPAFSDLKSKEECLEEVGLKNDGRKVVLITASGAKYRGEPSVYELYRQALQVKTPLQIVVICGRQKDLTTELNKIETPERHLVKIVGFTTVMHSYMKAADMIVTKPGGLTTAESLICGVVMVIVNPYPGQEMRNTDFLLESGVAVKCNDLYLLRCKLESLISNEERLKKMQETARKMGKPNAVHDICQDIAEGKYRVAFRKQTQARND